MLKLKRGVPTLEMQIWIRYLHPFLFDVDVNETLGAIKVRLANQIKVSPESLALVYDKKILEDTRTVNNYNIMFESTIHCVLRIRSS